jgi:hypothetical protein
VLFKDSTPSFHVSHLFSDIGESTVSLIRNKFVDSQHEGKNHLSESPASRDESDLSTMAKELTLYIPVS